MTMRQLRTWQYCVFIWRKLILRFISTAWYSESMAQDIYYFLEHTVMESIVNTSLIGSAVP